jgi:hypothetical protein
MSEVPPGDLPKLTFETWKKPVMVIIREARPSVDATCDFDAPRLPADWGVLDSTPGSGTLIAHQAYVGDMPLVLDGAYSSEIVDQLRIAAHVSHRLASPK